MKATVAAIIRRGESVCVQPSQCQMESRFQVKFCLKELTEKGRLFFLMMLDMFQDLAEKSRVRSQRNYCFSSLQLKLLGK